MQNSSDLGDFEMNFRFFRVQGRKWAPKSQYWGHFVSTPALAPKDTDLREIFLPLWVLTEKFLTGPLKRFGWWWFWTSPPQSISTVVLASHNFQPHHHQPLHGGAPGNHWVLPHQILSALALTQVLVWVLMAGNAMPGAIKVACQYHPPCPS